MERRPEYLISPNIEQAQLRISVIAEAALSEPFYTPVMTAIPYSLFHAAAETDIALPVISISQRNG
jgi:hypothetical protein